MEKKLANIDKLMELRFLRRQAAFSKICAEENRVRGEIHRLDKMAADANTTEYSPQKAIGADVIWKAWVGRTKTSLNRELALILAQKDTMLGSVRRDYGKFLVSQEFTKKYMAEDASKLRSLQLQNAVEQSLKSKR